MASATVTCSRAHAGSGWAASQHRPSPVIRLRRCGQPWWYLAATVKAIWACVPLMTLQGKSYRLGERGAGIVPAAQTPPLRDSA